jgi:hypothetical protein
MAKTKIDIEALVEWALVKQAARVNEDALSQEMQRLAGGGGDWLGVAQFLSMGGVRIAGGGANDRRTPADALTVATAIDRLPAAAAALMVIGARSGGRIGWAEEGVGRFEPVLNGKGKHKRRYEDQRQARGLLGWEWRWVGLYPDQVDFERLRYLTWWEAMVQLRVNLEGRLEQWEITGPARLAEPWNGAGAPVVLHAASNR